MRCACICSALVVICISHVIGKERFDGFKLIKVLPKTEDHLAFLQELEDNGYDFWTHTSLTKPTDILIPPSAIEDVVQKLSELDISYEMVNSNIQESIDQETDQLRHHIRKRSTNSCGDETIVGTFARHQEINNWMKKMAQKHSRIASIIHIGNTYEGRDMLVMKIGIGSCRKKAIWIDAGIHAREWIASATSIYVINKLLSEYTTDPQVRSLLYRYDWYILPVANPDGYEYSHTNNRLWRKTRTPTSLPGCEGVDGNRNFNMKWRETVGPFALNDPCQSTFAGDHPLSENCTQNLASFLLNNKQRFLAFFTVHSYGELMLTPWGYTKAFPRNYAELMRVGNIGVDAIKAVNGRNFTLGTSANVLYESSGTSRDWAYGVAGIEYVYTLELFPDRTTARSMQSGFIADISDIEPSGREIWEAFKRMVSNMRSGELSEK